MRRNTMIGNKHSLIVDGWDLSDYIQDIDTSNTVDGKPIYYVVSQKNMEIPAGAGYVGVVNCEGIKVKGQNLSRSGQGIMFAYTTTSVVEDSNISDNFQGIYLLYSSNNMIAHNNFIDNEYQVWSYYSTNTWDHGYPYGNYWSDYTGADTNNDGIGDKPYAVDTDNRDRYPLMNLWIPTPAAEHDTATSIVAPTFQKLGGLSVLDATIMNRGLSVEFNVQLCLIINGSTVESAILPLLEPGSSQSFSYPWTPTSEGTYNLTVCSSRVLGETLTDNNIATFLVTVATSLRVPEYMPTIQMAIDIANPGDTISVSPGIYYENILVTKDGLSLIGSGADLTIIDGQDKYNVIYAYEVTSFTVEGFTVRNSGHTGSNPGSVGIHINPNHLWGGNFAIRRCKIQDNWDGVAIWTHDWGTVIIENNIISDNEGNGIDASYPIGNGEAVIRCNTIVYNGRSGYYDFAGSGNRTIVNNIIIGNEWYGILSHPSTSKYIAHNNVWNNTRGSYYENPGWGEDTPFTPSPGTGEISADPLFVDAADRDYHLSEGSHCIDVGTNENASSIDLDGRPRPIDGNEDGIAIVDIGAYEFDLLIPPQILGDVNSDGVVNLQDIVLVSGIYGSTIGDPTWNPEADLASPYGRVDILDLVTCASHYGEKYP
jgi:parallel beta-helix repeat protein